MGVIQAIYFGFDVLQPLPELGQFRRRNQDHVELDHHQAGKFQILEQKFWSIAGYWLRRGVISDPHHSFPISRPDCGRFAPYSSSDIADV